MMHMSLFRSSLVALVLVATSSVARGEGLTAQDEANARFQSGLKFYDGRDFESARIAFAQAYAVLQKPGILLNLALSESYSNHPVEALEHFEAYLRDGAPNADKRDRAKKAMDEAYKKTGHLEIHASSGAEVKVDGRPLMPLPPVFHVTPGPHTVEAALGPKSKNAGAMANAGELTKVDVAFDGEPAAPPVTPPPVSEPPAEPRKTETFWGWRSIGGLAFVGASAVFLGLGLAASSDVSSDTDTIKGLQGKLPEGNACAGSPSQDCRDLASASDDRESARSRRTAMFVGSAITGGVGVGLVVSALVWPHERTITTGRIVPAIGPNQAGFLFSSHF